MVNEQNIFKVSRKFNKANDKGSVFNKLLPGDSPSTNKINQPMTADASSFKQGIKKEYKKSQSPIKDSEEVQIQQMLNEVYKWNQEKEKKFIDYKSDAKHRLFDEVKSSSWNGAGFTPLIHEFNMIEKNIKHRDALLSKYMNGEALGENDYKRLAETNILLNSCVDKNFLQNTVNYINPEILERVFHFNFLNILNI